MKEPIERTLLYPAGTRLWLTERFYPFAEGEQITIEFDWWTDDASGRTTHGFPYRMHVVESVVTDTDPAIDEAQQ